MMVPTFKSVVMLLASLQLTKQAALSSEFYNKKNVLGPLSSRLTFSTGLNVPSDVNSKEFSEYESVKNQEIKSFNIDRGSAYNFRAKRQLNQDSDLDVEITSNDPEILSYGKSMAMKTEDDDDTDKSQHENHEHILLNKGKGVDSETSNLLGVLGDSEKEANETSNEAKKIETTANAFLSKVSDTSTPNDATTPKPTDEETFDDSSSPRAHQNDSEIHIVPTTNYEVPVFKESNLEEESKITSMETSTETHEGIHTNKYNNNNDDYNVMSDGEHVTPNTEDQDGNTEANLQDEENAKGEVLQNTNEEKEDIDNPADKIPVSTYEMKEDETEVTHNDKNSNESTMGSEVTSATDDALENSNSIEKRNGNEEVIHKEVPINENEHAEVFNHFPVGSSDGDSSQLRASDNHTIDTDEGSGDIDSDITGSHETYNIDDTKDSSSSNNNDILEQMSPKPNNMDINIDFDSATENTIKEDGTESEDEAPISDPTQGVSKVDDTSKTLTLLNENESGEEPEELPLPKPTENSANIDLSQTYDPKTIVDPFNFDSPSKISNSFAKAFGIDNFEEKTENEELEGSGQTIVFTDDEFDNGRSKDDDFLQINPRTLNKSGIEDSIGDTTTSKPEDGGENEVSETMVTIHHTVQFNPASVPSKGQDSMSTESTREIATNQLGDIPENESSLIHPSELPIEAVEDILERSKGSEEKISDPTSESENDNDLPERAGINEVGLKNDNIKKPDDVPDTSSSSTGSFIVLGAIMATIVLLLGYSVIKSRRQKQQNAQIPPSEEDHLGTALTLLPEKNGHGPGKGLNVESSRLLSANEDGDKDDLEGDYSYPKSKNVNEGNGTGKQFNNVPKTEDPNILSEVRVNKPTSASPNNLDNVNQHVANGVGLKNSPPDHSHQLTEPNSPSTDDQTALVHQKKPEMAKAKMFTNPDSIPKTPVLIERNSKFGNVTY